MTTEAERQAEHAAIARKGDAWYEGAIRPLVEQDHHGEVVAIDVVTGDYALGPTALAASAQLRERQPEAEVWFVRVGFRALRHMLLAHPVTQ